MSSGFAFSDTTGQWVGIERFGLHGPDAALDLRAWLARARFPDAAPGPAWLYGTDLPRTQDAVSCWLDGSDWRAVEAA